jgi:hypothetical protein
MAREIYTAAKQNMDPKPSTLNMDILKENLLMKKLERTQDCVYLQVNQ